MSCTCVPNLVLLPQNARFTHIWSLSGWAIGAKLTTNAFMSIGFVTVMTIVQMVQMKSDVVCFKTG